MAVRVAVRVVVAALQQPLEGEALVEVRDRAAVEAAAAPEALAAVEAQVVEAEQVEAEQEAVVAPTLPSIVVSKRRLPRRARFVRGVETDESTS